MKNWTFLWMAVAWLLLNPWGLVRGSEPQKRLLVLYSYRMGGFPPVEMERAFESTLYKKLVDRLDLYTEYVDSIRFTEPEYQPVLRDFLRRKYAHQKFDLIIPISGPAIRMALELRDELFPGVPIVFGLGFRETLQQLKRATQITGVTVRLDPKGTLELALRAQPDTREVIVIGGKSPTDRYLESVARQELGEYESRVAVTYQLGRPLEEVLQAVASLPPRTIILFLSMSEDGAGRKLLPHDALIEIAQAANGPVYGLIDLGADTGIVGGSLLNFRIAGSETAEVALRVLDGERPHDIPIIEGHATVSIVDWRQLQRWGIKEANLPPGTIVRDKGPSFWQLYRWRIIGILSLCLIQAALIVGLLINRTRRASAERGLHRRLRFETLLSELSAEFMNLPANEAQTRIERWANRLREFLGLDEASFVEIPAESGDSLGHNMQVAVRDLPRSFDGDLQPYLDRLRHHETINLSNVTAEPEQNSGRGRIKSLLVMPISSSGSTYVVRFATTRIERQWPDELVSRLRVVGEIFVGALERQLAGQTLRESEERYRALVAAMAQVVWRTNSLGEVCFASTAWQDLTGQSDQEMCGFGWLDAVHPDDRDKAQQAWNQAVKTQSPYQDEYRVRSRDGSFRYFSVRAVPVLNYDGRVREWIGANTDITERLRAENELRQLTERLLTSQDEERRRIARELHDTTVQNLAVVIFDLAQLRRLGRNLAGQFQEVISKSVSLCEQIIKEIRTLSYVLHPPMLDEVGLAPALQWYVRGFTQRSGIQIELTILDGIGRLPSEVEIALFRIVQESLANILHYSGSASACIRLSKDKDQVLLGVQDRGRGMLLGTADSREGVQLLGVGIPGMRQRLQQLGGRLEIESSSFGTTVTAIVPLTRRAHAAHSGG